MNSFFFFKENKEILDHIDHYKGQLKKNKTKTPTKSKTKKPPKEASEIKFSTLKHRIKEKIRLEVIFSKLFLRAKLVSKSDQIP